MDTSKMLGVVVVNPKTPDWGKGKVVWVDGPKVHVIFENIGGKAPKIIDTRFVTLEQRPGETVPLLERLPPFVKQGNGLVLPKLRITLPELIRHFLTQFPGGFGDPAYLGEGSLKGSGERLYKVAAHDAFVAAFGDNRGEVLVRERKASDIAGLISNVLKMQNLLATQEFVALLDALHDEKATLAYATALFEYLRAPNVDQASFNAYAAAVMQLPQVGKFRIATWPVLTLLPFLAQPTRHMFLKPDVTKKAAEIVGFDLQYDSALRWLTYGRLLELANALMPVLRPLGARDFIDVQSFIWVAISYP